MALQQVDPVGEDDRMAECIDNCFEAAQACEWCTTAYTRMGEEDVVRCIELCRDVADLTMLHVRMMTLDSDYGSDLAETSTELCEECADECERHDAEHCQTCADALRTCADSCRDVASA